MLALALAACSSSEKPKTIDENLYPADFRAAVIKTVTSMQSFDPTNIRDASISDPVLKTVPGTNSSRYVACARFNPRDSSRQYLGLSEYAIYFYAGDITQFVKASGDACAGMAYKPFPELEKICHAEKCM